MALTCPRDHTELVASEESGVPCEACPQCKGAWFSLAQLEALEGTVASEDAMTGTIEYAEHPDQINCPSCGKVLQGFDFRGEELQLDACDDEHAFWLNADEADKIRQIMRRRSQDLQRSHLAESAWNQDRERGFQPTLTERLERLLLGGPRRQ